MRMPSLVQRSLRSIMVMAFVGSGCTERDGAEPPVESTSEAEDDDASSGSGEPATSSESGGSDSGSVGNESSSSGTLEYACMSENECVLHSDCCSCTALHVDEPVAACDASCDRNSCEMWGVTELLCAHTCHIRLLDCDATLVACDEAPPECDDGLVATVVDRCWTGYCVPPDLCRP